MDMTLAEQLVWAAVYANEWAKGLILETETTFGIRCAEKATQAVSDMRMTFKLVVRDDKLKCLLGRAAFDHLRQMTFKVED